MKKNRAKREPSEEIDLLDTMLSSLDELLEEKGILTQEEYEKRIMEKVKIKWPTLNKFSKRELNVFDRICIQNP